MKPHDSAGDEQEEPQEEIIPEVCRFETEIAFLAERGHRLELHPNVLPFLVRKGFHPKLGARPMRDAVERLVGDAVAECLLAGRAARGVLAADEPGDRLVVQ